MLESRFVCWKVTTELDVMLMEGWVGGLRKRRETNRGVSINFALGGPIKLQ